MDAAGKQKRNHLWRTGILIAIALGLAVLIIPSFVLCAVPARPTAQRNACINNLRQIDGAKEQWALETQATDSAPAIVEKIDQYIKGGHPKCPKGGTYTYGKVDEPPRCSIANHVLH